MLRPRLFRMGNSLRTFRRSVHSVPTLMHDFREGVPGLLSPAGFDMAWTQYQSLMLEKLSNLTAGMYWAIRSCFFHCTYFEELALQQNDSHSTYHCKRIMDFLLTSIQEENTNSRPQKTSQSNMHATQIQRQYLTMHQWHTTTHSSSQLSRPSQNPWRQSYKKTSKTHSVQSRHYSENSSSQPAQCLDPVLSGWSNPETGNIPSCAHIWQARLTPEHITGGNPWI